MLAGLKWRNRRQREARITQSQISLRDKHEICKTRNRLININDHGSSRKKLIIHSSFRDYQSSRISQRTSFFPPTSTPSIKRKKNIFYNSVCNEARRAKNKNHFHIYRLMPLEDWVNLYFSFRLYLSRRWKLPWMHNTTDDVPFHHHSRLIEVLIKSPHKKKIWRGCGMEVERKF